MKQKTNKKTKQKMVLNSAGYLLCSCIDCKTDKWAKKTIKKIHVHTYATTFWHQKHRIYVCMWVCACVCAFHNFVCKCT